MSDWFKSPTPLIIGHRGASADAPENTLSAFSLALSQGAHGIELDVRATADGVAVVIHDADLDSTTGVQGQVSQLTLKQIRELRIEKKHPIPTLDQVFSEFGQQLLYNIELKTPLLGDRRLADDVSDCIVKHKLQEKVLVSSFNPFALRQVRTKLGRTVPLGLVRFFSMSKYLHLSLSVEADHPESDLVNERYLAWAAGRGLLVTTWTVDDPQEARYLAGLGVNGLITNKPGLIVQSLLPGKKTA